MNNKKLTLNASDFQKFQYVASKPIETALDVTRLDRKV